MTNKNSKLFFFNHEMAEMCKAQKLIRLQEAFDTNPEFERLARLAVKKCGKTPRVLNELSMILNHNWTSLFLALYDGNFHKIYGYISRSIIAYRLNITHIDPIKYELNFDRIKSDKKEIADFRTINTKLPSRGSLIEIAKNKYIFSTSRIENLRINVEWKKGAYRINGQIDPAILKRPDVHSLEAKKVEDECF